MKTAKIMLLENLDVYGRKFIRAFKLNWAQNISKNDELSWAPKL